MGWGLIEWRGGGGVLLNRAFTFKFYGYTIWPVILCCSAETCRDHFPECLPFINTKKVRKFRLECKCRGHFGLPNRKISEINGTSSEVVQNSQPEFPNRKRLFHLLFLLVPGLSPCIRPGGDVHDNRTRTSHGNFHSAFTATFDQPVFRNKW